MNAISSAAFVPPLCANIFQVHGESLQRILADDPGMAHACFNLKGSPDFFAAYIIASLRENKHVRTLRFEGAGKVEGVSPPSLLKKPTPRVARASSLAPPRVFSPLRLCCCCASIEGAAAAPP